MTARRTICLMIIQSGWRRIIERYAEIAAGAENH